MSMMQLRRRRTAGPDEDTVPISEPSPRELSRRRWSRRLRRALPWVGVLLAMLLVAAASWAVFFSRYLAAENVRVVGTHQVSAAQVRAAAAVPVGTPLARVDLSAIRRRVATIPEVRSVDVARAWPHGIRITVTERVPVAVVDRGNVLQAIDGAGVLFGHFAHAPAGLPLIRTDPGSKGAALAEAARVAASLPRDVARRVANLEVASIDQIKLHLHHGRVVIWGSAVDSAHKAQVLSVLLRQNAHTIDVSVPGRPTTQR